MSPINLVPETKLTLEIDDFRFQINHSTAYTLMLFCLTESLDADKTNTLSLYFTSPTRPSSTGPFSLDEHVQLNGCSVYAERYEDQLRFVLGNRKEYWVQRSALLWLLHYKLKECYGDCINLPEMDENGEFTSGYRPHHDTLLNKTARLYPIIENGLRVTSVVDGKTYWLYMAIKPGDYTKIVWVDNNDDDREVKDYDVWSASGVFLSSGDMFIDGVKYQLHHTQFTWLYSHEMPSPRCRVEIFKELVASASAMEIEVN